MRTRRRIVWLILVAGLALVQLVQADPPATSGEAPSSARIRFPTPSTAVEPPRYGQPTLAPPREAPVPTSGGAAALTASRPMPTPPQTLPADAAPAPIPSTPATAAPAPYGAASVAAPKPTPSATIDGTGRPGEKSLEGVQQPTLLIEKLAPAEIQVGKPAVFETYVRNAGMAAAVDVEVRDVVPQGTQLLNTTPKAAVGPKGEIVWSLGTLRPGDEVKLSIELLPTTEGELGSTASVRFSAGASSRTLCTKPLLVAEVQAPRSVLAGDDVPLRIKISNPGTGVATGVLITEVVPANMTHEAGGELEYEIGNLAPGESRELDLSLRAVKPGVVLNLLHAKADGKLATEAKTQIEVIAPSLAVDVEGPKKRFLDRQATYTVSIANPGTASARGVELETYLPRGLQFVDANNAGEYDPATHSVRWLLEELPAKETGTVTLTTLPVEPGQQVLRIESSAERGVTARKEEAVVIEGAPAIVFQVVDSTDPIEVGGETTYRIIVSNQGSKEATGVMLAAALSDGMKVLDAEGPTRFAVTGRSVQFQPLAAVPPKSESIFSIRVQCLVPGDHRCHVQLATDDMRTPVTKEEGTRVYADE